MRTKVANLPNTSVSPKTLFAQGMELPFRGVLILGIFERGALPADARQMPNENFIYNYTGLTLDERIVLMKKAQLFLDAELQAALQIFDEGEISNDHPTS